MEIWKSHAPPSLFGGSDDCKKLITVMKPTAVQGTGTYAQDWVHVCNV